MQVQVHQHQRNAPVRTGTVRSQAIANQFQDVNKLVRTDAQFVPGRGSYIPISDDIWGLLEAAKALTVVEGRLERASSASGKLPTNAAKRVASAVGDQFAGALPFRGVMVTPQAHWDVDASHPIYGRYLQQWMSTNPAAQTGKLLLQLLQEKLRELKETVRSVP